MVWRVATLISLEIRIFVVPSVMNMLYVILEVPEIQLDISAVIVAIIGAAVWIVRSLHRLYVKIVTSTNSLEQKITTSNNNLEQKIANSNNNMEQKIVKMGKDIRGIRQILDTSIDVQIDTLRTIAGHKIFETSEANVGIMKNLGSLTELKKSVDDEKVTGNPLTKDEIARLEEYLGYIDRKEV